MDTEAVYRPANTPDEAPGACSDCRPVILSLFIGEKTEPLDEPFVQRVAMQLREVYGLRVSVQPSIAAKTRYYDAHRQQVEASPLLRELWDEFTNRSGPAPTLVVLTNDDLFWRQRPQQEAVWGGWIQMQDSRAYVVASAARLEGSAEQRRVMMLVAALIGRTACDFSWRYDPTSVMHRTYTYSEDQFDYMNGVLCHP